MSDGAANESRPTAMILAAGLGSRMRPLTDNMPKPMVPLNNRPLVDHVLDRLCDAGITQAVVNLHYLADVLERHVLLRDDIEILFSDERDEVLDTGGGVKKALSLLGQQPFMVHNSDSVWIEADEPKNDGTDLKQPNSNSNLERLISAWDNSLMDCLLMLAPCAGSLGYEGAGDFNLSTDDRLQRRLTGTTAPYVFAGVSIMKPELFADTPSGPFSLNLLWNRAMEAERLYGICAKGTWMHVGDPAALELAERKLAEQAPQ